MNKHESVLRVIAYGFRPPEELREEAELMGLTYEEILEMAYENMQYEAKTALEYKDESG